MSTPPSRDGGPVPGSHERSPIRPPPREGESDPVGMNLITKGSAADAPYHQSRYPIGCFFGDVRIRTAAPAIALADDPPRMPTFPAVSRSPGRASPATNSDMVNPIPARKPPPRTTAQDTPSGSRATPARTA